MKSLSGKELIKILIQHGWIVQRITGSHHILTKANSDIRLSVPVHGNKSLKIGLQKALLKLAEINID